MTTTGPTITFRQAAEHDACKEGMDAVARYMGYSEYRARLADVEVPIVDVLTVLGLGDALTCLEWVGEDRLVRLFAADCAERVVHLTGPDPRCLLAIRVARLYAHGLVSDRERRNASAAAWAAADAADADAAAEAAANAAYAAAGGVASFAASYAARVVPYPAERDWQSTRLRWYLSRATCER